MAAVFVAGGWDGTFALALAQKLQLPLVHIGEEPITLKGLKILPVKKHDFKTYPVLIAPARFEFRAQLKDASKGVKRLILFHLFGGVPPVSERPHSEYTQELWMVGATECEDTQRAYAHAAGWGEVKILPFLYTHDDAKTDTALEPSWSAPRVVFGEDQEALAACGTAHVVGWTDTLQLMLPGTTLIRAESEPEGPYVLVTSSDQPIPPLLDAVARGVYVVHRCKTVPGCISGELRAVLEGPAPERPRRQKLFDDPTPFSTLLAGVLGEDESKELEAKKLEAKKLEPCTLEGTCGVIYSFEKPLIIPDDEGLVYVCTAGSITIDADGWNDLYSLAVPDSVDIVFVRPEAWEGKTTKTNKLFNTVSDPDAVIRSIQDDGPPSEPIWFASPRIARWLCQGSSSPPSDVHVVVAATSMLK